MSKLPAERDISLLHVLPKGFLRPHPKGSFLPTSLVVKLSVEVGFGAGRGILEDGLPA